jgi:hypothetical protein
MADRPPQSRHPEHGRTLDPAPLRAALQERGADVDLIVELLDEGADWRRAQPAPSNGNGRAHLALVPPTESHNVPPQNLEAEESVLGAMMMSPGAIVAVSEILHPDGSDFYRESHANSTTSAAASACTSSPRSSPRQRTRPITPASSRRPACCAA